MTKKDGRRDFMKGKKLKKVFVAALSVVFALVVGIGGQSICFPNYNNYRLEWQ